MINRKFQHAVRGTARPGGVVVAAIVLFLSLPFQAGAQGGFSGPGRHEITNWKPGKVLDLDRNDQNSILRFSSRGTDSQAWDMRGGFLGGNSTGTARARLGTGFPLNSTLPKHSRDAESRAGLMGRHLLSDAAYDPPAVGQFLVKTEGGSDAAFSSDHPNPADLVFDKWYMHAMTPPMHNPRPFLQLRDLPSRAPVSKRCLQPLPQRWPMPHLRQNLLQFQSPVRAECSFFGSIDQ